MSENLLTSRLQQDYLNCPICLDSFTKPKILPCVHSLCEKCLQDYIASFGTERPSSFPCPICKTDTVMPERGVEGFKNNHVFVSLSETLANAEKGRPMPRPRQLLNQPQEKTNNDASSEVTCSSNTCSNKTKTDTVVDSQTASSASLLHSDGANRFHRFRGNTEAHLTLFDGVTNNTLSSIGQTVPSSDHVIAPAQPLPYPPCNVDPGFSFPSFPQLNDRAHTGNIQELPVPYGWNTNITGDSPHSRPEYSRSASWEGHNMRAFNSQGSDTSHVSPLYPCVPTCTDFSAVACTENLLFRFGKVGSDTCDFLKPVGLAISKEGYFVISDSSGDKNRILVFNSGGEPNNAFNCYCVVQDVTMTKGNEILAAVHKNGPGIRHFTMSGQCKGEYGKFFTFEEPCGIGQLRNGGVAISGTQNHCVYLLNDQMKLSTKFGRKGNGDGYFQHPAFIAVNSKDQIIVTDKTSNCIQVFTSGGKFKFRFGMSGQGHGQLQSPLGVCVDDTDRIFVADSGNFRVELFSSKGKWLESVVSNTQEIGDDVRPVNVAFSSPESIAVLLRGPYFAEVRVYSIKHKRRNLKMIL